MYSIVFRPRAQREFLQLDRQMQRRIERELARLAADPCHPGTKSLSGGLAMYRRARVGDCRIAYTVDEEQKAVRITAIGYRKDFYERLRLRN